MKLSNENLKRLTLHLTGINNILVDAMLNDAPERDAPGAQRELEIDVFVVEAGGSKQEPEAEPLDLDHLCGEWTAGKRRKNLTIFKAAPGYMAAWGKKPKKDETGDCYLIDRHCGRVSVCNGQGFVYLCYDEEKDVLSVFPGGEYKRVTTDKK